MKQIFSPSIKAYQGGIIASTISHICLLQSLDAASPEPTSETSAVASEQGGFSSTLENAAYGQGRGLFAGDDIQRVCNRVPCTIEFVGIESDFVGFPIPGVIATCSRCFHQTESIGTNRASVLRCLSLMRRNVPGAARKCPWGGSNEYEPTGKSEDVCVFRYPCPSGFNDQGQMNGVCSVCVCSVPVSCLWLTSLATSLRSGTCMRGLTTQGQRIPKFREIDTCIITSTRCSIVPIETKSRTS